jgi:hypothetical protein
MAIALLWICYPSHVTGMFNLEEVGVEIRGFISDRLTLCELING